MGIETRISRSGRVTVSRRLGPGATVPFSTIEAAAKAAAGMDCLSS